MKQPVTEESCDALDIAAERIADGMIAGVEAGFAPATVRAFVAATLATVTAFAAAPRQDEAGIAGRARRKARRAAVAAG